jgi:hypothetical protein
MQMERRPNGRPRPEPKPLVAVEVPEFLDAKHKPEIVMAPRAYWKGSLKLSLVSCPVALYPANGPDHMINKETGNRLKQQMVDAETGDLVEDGQKASPHSPARRTAHRTTKKAHRPEARQRKAS